MDEFSVSTQVDLDTESLAFIEQLRHQRRVRFPQWCVLVGSALYYLVAIQILEKLWNSSLRFDTDALLKGGCVGTGIYSASIIVALYSGWNLSWWYVTDPKHRLPAARVSHLLLRYQQHILSIASLSESVYTAEDKRILSRLAQRLTFRKRFLTRALIALLVSIAIPLSLENQKNFFANLIHVVETDSFGLGLIFAFMSGGVLTSPILVILNVLKLNLWPWEKHEALLFKSHEAWQTRHK